MLTHPYYIRCDRINCRITRDKFHFQVSKLVFLSFFFDFRCLLAFVVGGVYVCIPSQWKVHFDFTHSSPFFCFYFPCLRIGLGGKREPNDSSFIDCALRETEEEIGIARDHIMIWGETSLMRFTKRLSIMPVIGSIANYDCGQLKVNSDEVERVFTVSLRELCQQKKHTQFRAPDSRESSRFAMKASYSLPVFNVTEERIWGYTAMMTHFFLKSLLPAKSYNSQIPYVSKLK